MSKSIQENAPSADLDPEVTELIQAWQSGDHNAGERLVEAIYPWLHRIAKLELFRKDADSSIQVTELLHEAYIALSARDKIQWRSRQHFMAIAARIMRRILVDRARYKTRKKRGERSTHYNVEDVPVTTPNGIARVDMLALDQAIRELARIDSDAARLVEVRYFGGLTVEESADLMGISRSTVVRTWRYAKAWLRHALSPGPTHRPGDS